MSSLILVTTYRRPPPSSFQTLRLELAFPAYAAHFVSDASWVSHDSIVLAPGWLTVRPPYSCFSLGLRDFSTLVDDATARPFRSFSSSPVIWSSPYPSHSLPWHCPVGSRWSHEATEHLKYDWSELARAVSLKYTPDSKDLVRKKYIHCHH